MFEHDDLNLEIWDVLYIEREKSACVTQKKRPFHILTKRLSGTASLSFGKNVFSLSEQDLFYIPADTEYVRRSEKETLVAVHFDVTNRSLFVPVVQRVEPDPCDRLLLALYEAWRSKSFGYRYKCASLLYSLLFDNITPPAISKERALLQPSLQYIEQSFSAPIKIGELARLCHVSENYYRRIFEREFHLSPSDYLRKTRLAHAKEKLLSGYYSMAEVAEACGFSEQKYFNKVFKEETGLSPLAFKKAYYATGQK